jgi:hypothetical protein
MDMMDYFIKQNKIEDQPDLMTDILTPDNDSVVSTVDSIFGMPLLEEQDSSCSDESSFSNEDDYIETCNTTSTEISYLFGPPPPGSLMELWTPHSQMKHGYSLTAVR